jgi:hypothetical protein
MPMNPDLDSASASDSDPGAAAVTGAKYWLIDGMDSSFFIFIKMINWLVLHPAPTPRASLRRQARPESVSDYESQWR